MNVSDFINVGLFTVLLLSKTTRYASAVILAGYALYFSVIEPLPGQYYYHMTALLNLIIGCILFPRYKLVALLSFALIVVNNIGFLIYDAGYEPTLYNNLSLVIITIQILLLYIRAITDGIHIRGTRGRALVFIANCDSVQSNFEMLPAKEKDQK